MILCGYIVLYGQHYFQIRYNMKLAQPHTVIILSTELLWKPPRTLCPVGKSYWAIGSLRSQNSGRNWWKAYTACARQTSQAVHIHVQKQVAKLVLSPVRNISDLPLPVRVSCRGTGCVFLSVTSTHQGSHLESTVDAFTTRINIFVWRELHLIVWRSWLLDVQR